MTDINEKIQRSKIESVSNPLSGDCAGVAAAIKDVFGGEFICLYSSKDSKNEELPTHVAVDINGDIYDGSGKLTKQDLFEIHLVLNGNVQVSENPDEYIVYDSPPEYMVEQSVRESVRTILQS